METKVARTGYDDNLLSPNSKRAQSSSSSLGLINQILAKPRTTFAADAIYARTGLSPQLKTTPKSAHKIQVPHYDSDGGSPPTRPSLGVKKLKSSLAGGVSLDNLDKENAHSGADGGPTLEEFRRPDTSRVSRIHSASAVNYNRPRESRTAKPFPFDAGVMGSRSTQGQRTTAAQKSSGARLRSKSSSRVLDSRSEGASTGGFSLSIFGGKPGNRTSTGGKSAVELLEASKSLYVKSAQVRERKQEPNFSGVLRVTSHNADPTMLVSLTRDAASHAGRDRDAVDAGSVSDSGVVDGPAPCDTKPASLAFTPTPLLVHHSALKLKEIRASSSGELLDATASPSSSSSSRENLVGETPSTGDDVLDKFSHAPSAASSNSTPRPVVSHLLVRQSRLSTAPASVPSAPSSVAPPVPALKPRGRNGKPAHPSTVSSSKAPVPSARQAMSDSESLHASAKKLAIVSDASTTSDEEQWKREGHHPKKPRHQPVPTLNSSDLSRTLEVVGPDRAWEGKSVPNRLPTLTPSPHRPVPPKKRVLSAGDDNRNAGGIADVREKNLHSNISDNNECKDANNSPDKITPRNRSSYQLTGSRDQLESSPRETKWKSRENSNGSSPGKGIVVQRSKSDAGQKANNSGQFATLLQQKHSPDLDRFFDSMGIDQSVLFSTSESVDWDALGGGGGGGDGGGGGADEGAGALGAGNGGSSGNALGDSGSSLDSFPRTGSDRIRSTGSDFGDDEDGEGGALGRGHPLIGRNSRDVSVIERNARVIKWLYNVVKAKERTIVETSDESKPST